MHKAHLSKNSKFKDTQTEVHKHPWSGVMTECAQRVKEN